MPVYQGTKTEEKAEGQVAEPKYEPTDEVKARLKFVYDERAEMIKVRDDTYPQFNDRTLKQFIDDSEKRMNAYVPSREEQGKEEWQSNFATRAYANKAKALLAATARDIPGIKIKAVNLEGRFDNFAAEMMTNLVRHSYYQGNPQEEMFFLGWSCVCHGTVLSYEGFESQVYERKRIKSFDLLTGDVEEEVLKKESFSEPVSYEIQIMDLLIKNIYIRDIQEQPAIILQEFYADRERFDATYGKFTNAKFVLDCSAMTRENRDTFFHEKWKEAVKANKGYYVCRYMNKYRNIYRIVVNGVELYNGPMPWIDITRKNFGRPAYPSAKTIYEPFANTDFFYGNSQPNSAMGEGDTLNTLYNSSLDKQYRSLVPPLLIGMVNKDMLDLEDELLSGDTKIYVDDISQVKQLELKGVTDSDVKMIDLISRGLDLTTLDPQQQGVPQKYVTARAAVAADERARQLKGIFFMFMESLWLQKYRLRVPNVLLSYGRPKMVAVMGEEGLGKFNEKYRLFNVDGAELSDGTTGTLGIEFRPEADMADKKALQMDVEAEEQRNYVEGNPYEKVIMPYGKLEELSYDIEIIPETLWVASQATNMGIVLERVSIIQKMFPEYFAANKELLFKDVVKNYSDDAGRYELPKPMGFEEEQGLEMAKGMAGKSKSSAGGSPVGVDQGINLNNLVQ